MIALHNNFGLNGQAPVEEYDYFICLTKKCKDRKASRHKERIARRQAKTDSMKADTERVRAETDAIKQVPLAPVAPTPITQATAPTPPAAAPANAGIGLMPMLLLGGLLLGGMLFMKKKPAAPAVA